MWSLLSDFLNRTRGYQFVLLALAVAAVVLWVGPIMFPDHVEQLPDAYRHPVRIVAVCTVTLITLLVTQQVYGSARAKYQAIKGRIYSSSLSKQERDILLGVSTRPEEVLYPGNLQNQQLITAIELLAAFEDLESKGLLRRVTLVDPAGYRLTKPVIRAVLKVHRESAQQRKSG